MGWNNPSIPWSELERKLSDQRRPGRGRRSSPTAATAPRGRASGGPYRPPGASSAGRPDRALRRAARALDVQLPRRRLVARGARRGGAAARPARARDHRPRRLLRHRAVRRGGRELARARRPCSAPSSRSGSPSRRTAIADPEGEHLLVLARGGGGLSPPRGRDHRTRSSHGGEKGRPGLRPRQLAEQAGGEWVVLTGCRKGAVRRALADGGRGCRGARARPAGRAVRARRTCDVELIDHGASARHSTRNDALAGARRPRAGCRSLATNNVHYATPRASTARRGARRGARATQPRRARRMAARLRRRAPAHRAPRWPRGSRATPARSRAR